VVDGRILGDAQIHIATYGRGVKLTFIGISLVIDNEFWIIPEGIMMRSELMSSLKTRKPRPNMSEMA
jgi:hypothetical protein